MDTSLEYIQMCEAAQEIQDLIKVDEHIVYAQKWKKRGSDIVDYSENIGDEKYGYDISVEMSKAGRKLAEHSERYIDKLIWLPRQDQLQEMIMNSIPVGKLNNSVLGFYTFCIQSRGYKKSSMLQRFDTYEKLWLSFAMEHLYHKIWKGKTWEVVK